VTSPHDWDAAIYDRLPAQPTIGYVRLNIDAVA